MKKVKLQLNASQWKALMLIIKTGVPLLNTKSISHLAYTESLQKLFLRLINKLPSINCNNTKKLYNLTLNMNEGLAIYMGLNTFNCGEYEAIVLGNIKCVILKQIN